jgi:hypothetical protein
MSEDAMNYLCLIYRDRATQPDVVPVLDNRDGLWGNASELRLNTLHAVQGAITIRVRGRQIAIAEGSRGGPGDSLAEFCLIQARDLNDAIRIAARLPPAHLGSIEIRGIVADHCGDQSETEKDWG